MAQIFMNPRKPYIHPRPKGKFAYKPLNEFKSIIEHNVGDPFIFYDDVVVIRPSLCVANSIEVFSPIYGVQTTSQYYYNHETVWRIGAKFKKV